MVGEDLCLHECCTWLTRFCILLDRLACFPQPTLPFGFSAAVNWMYAAKMDSEGAAMYDAAVALRDAMIELEVAVDGGKDSLSMAAAAGERSKPCRTTACRSFASFGSRNWWFPACHSRCHWPPLW